MTRASKNSLVLDGSEVKLRLQAERTKSKTPVHVDWVRFTVIRRNAPLIMVENLFPLPFISDRQEPEYRAWAEKVATDWTARNWRDQWREVLCEVPDSDHDTPTQALELAQKVAKALGSEYSVNHEIKKGHDFYKFRLAIERNHVECGWVGFLASSDSKRQQSQAETIHCNLFGMACTFAASGWRRRLYKVMKRYEAKLTRCDLALDFFDGYQGGIQAIKVEYEDGLCNVGGKLLKYEEHGDWSRHSKGARSLYFGSKEAGKQTNCYEKGDQLFGVEAGSEWLRVEVRWGNKLRELPLDMVMRPADYFAGASDWHKSALAKLTTELNAKRVRVKGRRAIESVKAECYRSLKWFMRVCGPTFSAILESLDEAQLLELAPASKRPGRVDKFTTSERIAGYLQAFGQISQSEGPPSFAMA